MRKEYKFETFDGSHMKAASELLSLAYIEERKAVGCLPGDIEIPPLDEYVKNKLGISAFLDGELVGFLCCLSPWDNFFGTSRGTFVPVNAHAAVKEDRKNIYSRLYALAAEVWVREGILSHAIGIYAHDADAVGSFFENGFGLRTIDAVMSIKDSTIPLYEGKVVFREIQNDEYYKICPLRNGVISHLNGSPMFMPLRTDTTERFLELVSKSPRRYIIAEYEGEAIAYVKLTAEGESYISESSNMMNITGAYIVPEFRGKGIYQGLLAYAIEILKEEGYKQLGVDFESFNPTAKAFWLKYFTPYIYGLTRRIDERIMKLHE